MLFYWFWLKLELESNKTKLNRKEGLYHESKGKSFTQKLARSSPIVNSERSKRTLWNVLELSTSPARKASDKSSRKKINLTLLL